MSHLDSTSFKNTSSGPLTRATLEAHFNALLKPTLYKDYGPNGLQVEGREEIKKIAFAVSATRDSVAKACAQKADALIVHHGLFWDFHGVRTLTGSFAKRVLPLIKNDINLFGYHLPLDAQPELGNAASIARLLALEGLQPFGDYKGMPTGVWGRWPKSKSLRFVHQTLENLLNHKVLVSCPELKMPYQNNSQKISQPGPEEKNKAYDLFEITTLGIITGGANSGWRDAAALKLDGFLTGEMSEHDWHEAQEAGVCMLAGGHHATEVFGIQNLMKNVSSTFVGVECFFITSENPA